MKETEAYIVYPEYFNKNLPRRKGRKLPLEKCVKRPKLKELKLAAEKLSLTAHIQKRKHHPANWIKRRGRLLIDNRNISASKRTVLKKMGKALPIARKIIQKRKARKKLKEKRKRKGAEKYIERVLKEK